MKLKKIRWFRTKNAFGLGVSIFSFWVGRDIDGNAPLRPLIRDIPIDRMTGLTVSVVFRHRLLVGFSRWIHVGGSSFE
jgi:hypothetical protein